MQPAEKGRSDLSEAVYKHMLWFCHILLTLESYVIAFRYEVVSHSSFARKLVLCYNKTNIKYIQRIDQICFANFSAKVSDNVTCPNHLHLY